MKRILGLICGAAIACVAMTQTTGCKTLPQVDQVYGLAYSAGLATGFGVQVGKVAPETQQEILKIVEIVHATIPGVDETFEQKWMPVIDEQLKILVAEKKLDDKQYALIYAGSVAACKGIDYLFYRHPDWKQYEELVAAGADGFCTGFSTVIKPANEEQAKALKLAMDQVTYDYVVAQVAR